MALNPLNSRSLEQLALKGLSSGCVSLLCLADGILIHHADQ